MFWDSDEDFERECKEIDEAVELIVKITKKSGERLTWREAYPYLRGKYPIFVRDNAVDTLLNLGVVYDDDEFTKEFIEDEGALLSRSMIIAALEERMVDPYNESVEELLNKVDDRKTLAKLIEQSSKTEKKSKEILLEEFKAAGFETKDINFALANATKQD